MSTSFKSKVHPKIAAYFGTTEVSLWESFVPGRGWRREAPRLSLTRISQLRSAGATRIAIRCGDRIADFSINELA